MPSGACKHPGLLPQFQTVRTQVAAGSGSFQPRLPIVGCSIEFEHHSPDERETSDPHRALNLRHCRPFRKLPPAAPYNLPSTTSRQARTATDPPSPSVSSCEERDPEWHEIALPMLE